MHRIRGEEGWWLADAQQTTGTSGNLEIGKISIVRGKDVGIKCSVAADVNGETDIVTLVESRTRKKRQPSTELLKNVFSGLPDKMEA